MKIDELKKLKNEGVESLPSEERRKFLRFGLSVTGVFLGGSVLSLTPDREAKAIGGPSSIAKKFPQIPLNHYLY